MAVQLRFAIAGPVGSGKTTLARTLAKWNPESICIEEPPPPSDVRSAHELSSVTAKDFQELISKTRHDLARDAAIAPLLIFDRTFEEDREVFLPLYESLGFLRPAHVDYLRRLSTQCEEDVGAPQAGIVLTALPQILLQRVHDDPQARPKWLLEHLSLQFHLYSNWISRMPAHFRLYDTSNVDPSHVAIVAQRQITRAAGTRGDVTRC